MTFFAFYFAILCLELIRHQRRRKGGAQWFCDRWVEESESKVRVLANGYRRAESLLAQSRLWKRYYESARGDAAEAKKLWRTWMYRAANAEEDRNLWRAKFDHSESVNTLLAGKLTKIEMRRGKKKRGRTKK